MNMSKFMDKFGFAFALYVIAVSAKGSEKIADYALAIVITIASIILLFESLSSKPRWKLIVSWADRLEISYVGFGLGLMTSSSQLSSNAWVILLILFAGGCFASYGIGKLIGTGVRDVMKVNVKIGLVFGFIILAAGVAVLILRWNLITSNPSHNVDTPVLLILLGLAIIYLGWRRWRRLKEGVPSGPEPGQS